MDEFTKDKESSKGKKPTVVVGMTGGVDSSVAAFLLKKQGYNCIGIGIQTLDSSYIDPERPEFSECCTIKKLEEVKNVCDFLDIPFYAVNGRKEFTYDVLDEMVSNSIQGLHCLPCLRCNTMKIKILIDKAKQLKADYISTGHYAKIQKNASEGNFQLVESNDKEYDQTFLLAGLEGKDLEKIIFPLDELRRKEVEKIAKIFKLPIIERRNSLEPCFVNKNGFSQFIESQTHDSFRPPGSIITQAGSIYISDHKGVHNFFVGEKDLEEKINSAFMEKDLRVVKIDSVANQVVLGTAEEDQYSQAQVYSVNLPGLFDHSKPLPLIMKLPFHQGSIKTRLYFKNNNSGVLTFDEKVESLANDMSVCFYMVSGKSLRFVGSAKIGKRSGLSLINRVEALESRPDDPENEESEQEIKAREYKF